MKNFKILLTLFLSVIVLNSCSDDNLYKVNPNELSPDTFFQNEAQVQSAVNAAYANLQTRGLYSRHMFFGMDNMSHENAGNPQLEADKRQYLDFSFDGGHGAIGAYWESCYRGINKANFVINNADKINEIPDSFLSASRKAKFIGEAKFLRGLYYFFLVTRFGDIPLYTATPEDGEGLPKSSVADVYAQIVADLQDASGSLLEKDNEDTGRANRGAAVALLGKVYLFMGQKGMAMTEFQSIYGDYQLEDNYFDNFTEEDEHGQESIFEIEYDDDLGTSAKWNSDRTGAGPNEATFRGQEYGCLNWFNVYPSDDLLDEYEAGDTRYQDNFYSVGDAYAGGTATITAADLTAGDERRAGWKKYQNYYKDTSEDQDSGINFKYLRYSDVLLMMAECVYETNPGDAMGYINEVRSRPSVGLADVTGLSGSALFDAIVHERKVELAGEQCRFNDIVRWGNAATELAGTNFQAGKHERWPIPNIEIQANNALTDADQNPGY